MENCKSCKFWRHFKPDHKDGISGEVGTCQRRAPTAFSEASLQYFSFGHMTKDEAMNSEDCLVGVDIPKGNQTVGWPVTWDQDWCGDFEEK